MNILKIIEGTVSGSQCTVTIANTLGDRWEIVDGTLDTPIANNRAVILLAAGAETAAENYVLWLQSAAGWTELLTTQHGVGATKDLYVAAWWRPRTVTTSETVTVNFYTSGGSTSTDQDMKAWAIVVGDTADVDLAYDGQDTAINTITFPALDIELPGDLSILAGVIEDGTTDITTPTGYALENIEAGAADWALALYSSNVSAQSGLSVTTSITGAEWHALHITANGMARSGFLAGDF
jgi:hypothetical protein